MFTRVEVAIKPEYSDPNAQSLLKRIHGQLPELRKKIRWARLIDVYWIDVPRSREDLIPACQEIFQDRVTQWLFTGNLIPSASGKQGSLEDLMEASPVRPGSFWGLERRLRTGLTDSRALAALEALRVVLGSDLSGATTATGQLLLLEGAQLAESDLSRLAREVWCNEISETWTLLPELELVSNDRFHQEKRHHEDVPRFDGAGTGAKPSLQGFARRLNSPRLATPVVKEALSPDRPFSLSTAPLNQLLEFSKVRGWDWGPEHWKLVRSHWAGGEKAVEPSELDLALVATCWSELARGRVWTHEFVASDKSRSYLNLLSETLGATVQQQPKSWLIASDGVSEGGRPAILAASGQVNVAWAARVSSDAAARDPQAEALQTILGVQRDLLAADSFAVPLMQSQAYEGEFLQKSVARRAAELASNRTQVPMLAGADLGEGHSPGAPLLLVSSAVGAIFSSQAQGVKPGDRLGWLATGVFGPASLEDPVSQRKWVDALREAQLKGLFSGLRSSGPLPALWAAVQLARQAGGALVSPPVSQLGEFLSRKESLMVAVRPDRWAELKAHLEAWGIQLTGCGSFDSSGKLELHRGSEIVASTSLSFLWEGGPKRKIEFSIQTPRSAEVSQPDHPPFKKSGDQMLVRLLALPEVRSPERMLQAFDLEAQAHSVLKPLHSVSVAEGGWVNGPNDGAVIMVNPPSERLVEASSGEDLPMLALALGASVRPTAPSASWRAWMSVDEAIRNLVCTGAQVGADETLCALSVQWKGESPERHPGAAAELVETLEALREASVALGIPIVTAAASFSTQPMSGTLVCHALGRLRAVRWARSSDFKSPSDAIYVLGPDCQTLAGSLFAERYGARSEGGHASGQSASSPDWPTARKIYGWLGGVLGKEQGRVRSLHDISEGGLLVAVTEAIVARGLGAALRMPDDLLPEAWAFGEGFHRILTSCSEADSSILESEWNALGIPYRRLGSVTSSGRLEIIGQWSVPVAELRKAWRSEEVWA